MRDGAEGQPVEEMNPSPDGGKKRRDAASIRPSPRPEEQTAPLPESTGPSAHEVPSLPRFPAAVRILSRISAPGMITAVFPLVYGLPALALFWIFTRPLPSWAFGIIFVTSPLLFSALVITVAGALSLPCQPAVRRILIPRDLGNPIYTMRRLYGVALCAVLYFRPVFNLVLQVPPLKVILFRLFGYRGSMRFTIYPDTWIRDLRLVHFGEDAYISNRVTVGTNIVLNDGQLYVDGVTVGRRSTIGHLTMLAPGVWIGEGSEIGVGCAVGLRARVGNGTRIAPTCAIDHAACIGDRVRIGPGCYIGARARIHDGVRLPPRSVVAKDAVITVEDDLPNSATATG